MPQTAPATITSSTSTTTPTTGTETMKTQQQHDNHNKSKRTLLLVCAILLFLLPLPQLLLFSCEFSTSMSVCSIFICNGEHHKLHSFIHPTVKQQRPRWEHLPTEEEHVKAQTRQANHKRELTKTNSALKMANVYEDNWIRPKEEHNSRLFLALVKQGIIKKSNNSNSKRVSESRNSYWE